MNVLIACEYSAVVRDAFRARGHHAWSCDLLPTLGDSRFHIQGDAGIVAWDRAPGGGLWELMIAHPPCTDLALSGSRWFAEKWADGRITKAMQFFMHLMNAPIAKKACENPVGLISTLWRKPDQYIQPWQHGHGEVKKTGLWLQGLPLLVPSNIVPGREPRVHFEAPGPDRWMRRSTTLPGIAAAMASQWG